MASRIEFATIGQANMSKYSKNQTFGAQTAGLDIGNKTQEGGSSSGIHYSTEEHVVGTWIDDKPLYEKTIAIDNIVIGYKPSESIQTRIPHGISNLKEVISLEYAVPFFNKTGSNAVYGGTTAPSLVAYFIVTSTDIEAAGGTDYHGAAVGRYWYFTIRYTKTTD